MDEGDLCGSLPWFTEALQLDSRNLSRKGVQETHQVRIAAVLQQCPKIVQMWFRTNPVTFVEFSRNNKQLLTASSFEGGVRWDIKTGQPIASTHVPGELLGKDWAKASFSPLC